MSDDGNEVGDNDAPGDVGKMLHDDDVRMFDVELNASITDISQILRNLKLNAIDENDLDEVENSDD